MAVGALQVFGLGQALGSGGPSRQCVKALQQVTEWRTAQQMACLLWVRPARAPRSLLGLHSSALVRTVLFWGLTGDLQVGRGESVGAASCDGCSMFCSGGAGCGV
eukprot:933358-Alexandrium_andersonii.AAC.1